MSKKKYFDKHASFWDDLYYSNIPSELEKLVLEFKIKERNWVLDVGSGTGVLLPYLLEHVGPKGRVFELDFSLKMLKEAKTKGLKGNIYYINSDVSRIPLKENLFDKVVCFGAFAHFPLKRQGLSEMARVLKKGKQIFIAHLLSSEEIKMHHKGAGEEVEFDVLPEENRMIKMMKSAGIKNIKIIDRPSLYLASGIKK